MASPIVPKLALTPVKFKRLESLTENVVSDNIVVETERNLNGKNPRKKKKKMKKRRLSRRDSMMTLLRDELQNMEALPALRSYRPPSVNEDWLNTENDTAESDDEAFASGSKALQSYRRRLSYAGNPFSQIRRSSSLRDVSRASPSSAEEVIVSGYEMKKIRMMQSLEMMGIELPKRRVQNADKRSDERDILHSMEYAKRQSLSTRLLQNVNRNFPKRERRRSRSRSNERNSMQKTPELRPITNEETRDKINNLLNAMTKKVIDPKNPVAFSSGKSNIELANETIGAFRRRIRKRKVKPIVRWRRLAKLIVLLFRAWKFHSQSVNSILGTFDTLDALTELGETKDLLFDVSNFKAGKEATISAELRRIMEKPPGTRTPEELYYVQIGLRNYQSIAEYPVDMQRKIAERSWYETYQSKRVIVREGHIPMSFYFLLTGSAVVSYMDLESNSPKTVLFLHRGDSFGEQAIMTQSLRQTTVISRERVELLVMADEDFIDIFMSGGLRDANDPFIKSLKFLEGWPIEKLADNPKKAIFSFFKRGTVLIKDTSQSDWIVVVKSGSCTLLKRLHLIDPTKKQPKSKQLEWREKIEECLKIGATLSHEDQITLLCEEEVKKLEQQNISLRYYALPEINVATNEAYNDLRQMHNQMLENNFIKRTIEDLKQRAANEGSVITDEGLELDEESKYQLEAKNYRRMSIVDLTNLVSKGPFMSKPKKTDNTKSATTHRTTTSAIHTTTAEEEETYNDYLYTGIDVTQERISNHPASGKSGSRIENDGGEYAFVNCHTLTKGDVFGLADLCFENQPDFSLVSNGVEVIMINKKFYTENMTNNQLVRLRDHVWPYPTSEELQSTLNDHIRWNYHKKLNLKQSLRDVRLRNLPEGDSRAHLSVPKVDGHNGY